MAYKVRFAERAILDAEEYREYIAAQSNDDIAANAWLAGLLDAATSLQELPLRCAIIPEQSSFRRELRQLIYASHRVIFHIAKDVVHIVRVYHSASRPLRTLQQRPSTPRK